MLVITDMGVAFNKSLLLSGVVVNGSHFQQHLRHSKPEDSNRRARKLYVVGDIVKILSHFWITKAMWEGVESGSNTDGLF